VPRYSVQRNEAAPRAAAKTDPLENAVEALTDLFLLAACDDLIFHAQSAFSLSASYFKSRNDAGICPLHYQRSILTSPRRQWLQCAANPVAVD
jgi:hypothetical protein